MLELDQLLDRDIAPTPTDSLTLTYDERVRGRLRATTDRGRDVGLFLERGGVLRDGDCLQASSGEIIRVRAADEPVVTARVPTGLALARLCYHLGNRHVALAIGADEASGWVRFPPDHVLEDLAERLGARLERHEAPFDPEPGAYGRAGHHGHHHHHGHAHDHVHAH
ncbi:MULTISPECIES: urease accessory protein UreE [unclassified Guyparkeria]|uniref:urease accessory protein UreE n=1 Tax=unclassified Guyparkeria TaxID=2626246 RepID=UPI0007339310|nr:MULTISPECIES: urease accessory protein UreE [unclassified Guyparkeria]KTG17005.1 urease accessory protein UreE [Guyparkeria sp. XI15]OAE86039.1 urease accessory protein UreE [Guyparkeria sp. WRN-7]